MKDRIVKITLVNTLTNDYEKEYLLNVEVENFLEENESELADFIDDELCWDQYGIYEYDGCAEDDNGNYEIIIQVNLEENVNKTKEDINNIYIIIESKVEKYLQDNEML